MFTASEYSVLSTKIGNPSLQSFMKVNTARSTNVAKLFANMKHLGFFSECFTELFHSIFGQLFRTFVFSFSSHRSVLHYIYRELKKLRRQLQGKRRLETELCVKLSLLRLFHVDHVVQNRRSALSLACHEWFSCKGKEGKIYCCELPLSSKPQI